MTTLPTPTELAAERDPSRRLLALVEPATELLVQASAVVEANEIRSQAAAIERYARTLRLVPQAIGAAQTIARRAEVRIGELDQRRTHGGDRRSSDFKLSDTNLKKDLRHDFRTMAEAAPAVEEVLEHLAPEGKATRAAVLRAVKRDRAPEPARCVTPEGSTTWSPAGWRQSPGIALWAVSPWRRLSTY